MNSPFVPDRVPASLCMAFTFRRSLIVGAMNDLRRETSLNIVPVAVQDVVGKP